MVYVTHERKTIRNVPEELWQRLRVLAAERNTTISKLVVEASENYFSFIVKAEDVVVEAEEYLE